MGYDAERDGQRGPGLATGVEVASPTAQQGAVPPQTTFLGATWLAAGHRALKDAGFSETVANRIVASQAKSTLEQYQNKWDVFQRYCEGLGIDPYEVKVPQVADFLNHLLIAKA